MTIRDNKLLLLERDSSTESWLVSGAAANTMAPRHALAMLRQLLFFESATSSALRRIVAEHQRGWSDGDDQSWSQLVQHVEAGKLAIDPDFRVPPPYTPTPPTPFPPNEIVDDDRALFITRCDPELGRTGPLTFTYLIRELADAPTTLKIHAEGLAGAVGHERLLDPRKTVERELSLQKILDMLDKEHEKFGDWGQINIVAHGSPYSISIKLFNDTDGLLHLDTRAPCPTRRGARVLHALHLSSAR